MFFPLGLGLRTKTFPFVTLLIILCCSLIYGLDHQRTEYEMEYTSLGEHREVERAYDHLFYEYCKKNLANALCDRFALEKGLFFERKEPLPFISHDISGSPESLLEFANLYEEFALKLQRKKNELKSLPSYLAYSTSINKLQRRTQRIRERYNLLHRDNLTIIAVISAVFSHEGLLHLVGNMFFLFIFGRYVEARVGHFPYLLCYLVLGSAALALYAYLTPEPFLHVLGASANVSVVMGAFYTLFFHHKLKVFFFYISAKVVEFPVKTFMFLFFMLQEFVFSLTAVENVAYLAHAIGLSLGMGFGYIWGKARPLPADFLYDSEWNDWLEALKETDKGRFVGKALEILKYNPSNKTVIRAVVNEIAPSQKAIQSLELDEELLLRRLIPVYLRDLYKRKEMAEFYRVLEKIPHSWSLSVCLSRFSQKELLSLIDSSIDQGLLLPSVLIIQTFLERYKSSPKVYNLLKTLKSVLDHMPLTEGHRKHLSKIKDLTSSEGVRLAIGARLVEES